MSVSMSLNYPWRKISTCAECKLKKEIKRKIVHVELDNVMSIQIPLLSTCYLFILFFQTNFYTGSTQFSIGWFKWSFVLLH